MALLVVSYGGGVNSTAMLIGMAERGERVDLILFADTGGERPETYAYVERFSKWLLSHGMPPIKSVHKTTKRPGRFRGANESLTLERRCLEENTLPSIAYGFKTCSLKFKREPQDEFVALVQRACCPIGPLERVHKFMGYDAGEPWRATITDDELFVYHYPLVEQGHDREDCVDIIVSAGLCVPPKSSCFFCPNMQEIEVLDLRDKHPELLKRALDIESQAISTPGSTIKGLGRDVSWKQILEYDAAQGSFFPRVIKHTPCECYDG